MHLLGGRELSTFKIHFFHTKINSFSPPCWKSTFSGTNVYYETLQLQEAPKLNFQCNSDYWLSLPLGTTTQLWTFLNVPSQCKIKSFFVLHVIKWPQNRHTKVEISQTNTLPPQELLTSWQESLVWSLTTSLDFALRSLQQQFVKILFPILKQHSEN